MTGFFFDALTARSVRILAAAVDQERTAGAVALAPVTDALARAIGSGRSADLASACHAFDRVDGAVRRRVADRSRQLALAERREAARHGRGGGRRKAAVAATGFLGALNHGRTLGPGARAATPRTEARTRLLADMMGDPPPGTAEPRPAFDGPPPKWWTVPDEAP